MVSERKVRAGDTILVHAGLYKGDRLQYSHPLGLDFDGTYVLTAKGTPERPIVIRARGRWRGDLRRRRRARVVQRDGRRLPHLRRTHDPQRRHRVPGGLERRDRRERSHCSQLPLEDVGIAVNAQYSGSHDFYITDNVMLGRDDRYRLLGWFNPGIYGGNRLKSYYAVKVYGSGHVVSHNYIAYFHDGISVCTHGSPDPEEDRRATAIDFYNNDIHLMADDFIEADGGVHNIRIMRNRGVNAATVRPERAAGLRRTGLLYPQCAVPRADGMRV